MAYWSEWSHDVFEVEQRSFGRAATDMTWAADNTPVLDDFLDYEVEATRFARAYPQVAVCLYDLERFRGNVIIPVLKVHPKVPSVGCSWRTPTTSTPTSCRRKRSARPCGSAAPHVCGRSSGA